MFLGGFQVLGGLVNSCGDVFDYVRYLGDLRVRLLPLFLVHIFADGGNGLGAVTGVRTGRVDLVFEPGAFRETFSLRNKRGIRSRSALTGASAWGERAGESSACRLAKAFE